MDREIMVWPPAKDKNKNSGPGFGTYARPWITTALMIPAGWAAHAAWGDAGLTTGLAATAIASAGSAVTWAAWRLCRARTWYAAIMAPATSGGITAWMATATIAGTGRPWIDMLVVGGGLLSGMATVHTWQRGQGAPKSGATVWDRPLPSWEEVAEVVGLRGTRMSVTEDSELRRVGTVQLRPGQTVDALQGSLSAIASAMRLPRRSVRAVEDPEDCSRAEITIVRRDVLRDPIQWHALEDTEVGISIADAPLELGTYEDGVPFADDLFDHHTMTVGMSGSGKSTYAKLKIIQVAARDDAVVLAVDVAKGRQTLGPVSNAILWPAYTMADARALLRALRRAVTARADYLGSKGLANWEKGCGLAFLHVLLEEAAQLVEVEEIVALGQLARSAGIHLEVSLQRATYTNIDTDARANFSSRICLGVSPEEDVSKVLPEYVLDAGADPAQWADRQQGCAYAAVKSQPQQRHATPLRFHNAPNAALEEAAAALPNQDAKLDDVTRAALGAAYEEYRAQGHPQDQELPAMPATDHQDDQDPAVTYTIADPDPDIPTPTLDDPLDMPAGAAAFNLPPAPRSRESAADARARLTAQLRIWQDQGHQTFRAPDLRRALADEHGLTRSRSWVIAELGRLASEGRVIHHDGGEYEITTGDRELVNA